MKRVLDSTVGFKWVVPELHSDKALRLRDDYRNGIVELIAPDIHDAALEPACLDVRACSKLKRKRAQVLPGVVHGPKYKRQAIAKS